MALGVCGQNGNVALTVETQLRRETEHVSHQLLTLLVLVHMIVMGMQKRPMTALQDAANVSEYNLVETKLL